MNNNSINLTFKEGSKSLQATVLLPQQKEDTYRVKLAGHTNTVACRVIQDPSRIGFFQRIYHTLFCIEATATVSFEKTVRVFINKNSLNKRINDKEAVNSLTQTFKTSAQTVAEAWSEIDERSEFIARPKQASSRTPGQLVNEGTHAHVADRVYSLFFREKAYVYFAEGKDHVLWDRKQPIGRGGENIVYKDLMLSTTETPQVVVRKKSLRRDKLKDPTEEQIQHKLQTLENKEGIATALCTLVYHTRGTHRKNTERHIELVPYYNKGSLCEVMKQINTPAEQKKAAKQLLTGLASLHEAGILHRDIKPENVLVHKKEEELSLAIADFGFACLMNKGKATTLLGKSTFLYLPPEEITRIAHLLWFPVPDAPCTIEVGTSSDIWQMGLTLYQLVHEGAFPVPLMRANMASRRGFIQSRVQGALSYRRWWLAALTTAQSPLDRTILQMIHPDPRQRPSARQALETLTNNLAQE